MPLTRRGLSREETEALVEQGKRLAAYQESEDRPEDLARIPVLKLSDIPREAERIPASLEEAGGVKVLRTQVETNGIGYVELDFGTEQSPRNMCPIWAFCRQCWAMWTPGAIPKHAI